MSGCASIVAKKRSNVHLKSRLTSSSSLSCASVSSAVSAVSGASVTLSGVVGSYVICSVKSVSLDQFCGSLTNAFRVGFTGNRPSNPLSSPVLISTLVSSMSRFPVSLILFLSLVLTF